MCLTPTAVWARHIMSSLDILAVLQQKTYGVDPCLQVEHLILLYLNRTEPITVCQVQAGRQQQLRFQELQEFTEENQMLPERLHIQRGMRKGRAVHSPFTADVTTSSKMSFTTSWAPSSVPTYTPNMNTDRCFQGKKGRRRLWQ